MNMGKTLIVSDIHGNRAALSAVIHHADRHFQFDELWCLGDIVGYGPAPLAVWQLLREFTIPAGGWLAGNHDWGLVDRLNGPTLIPLESGLNGSSAIPFSNFRDHAWDVLKFHRLLLEGREDVLEHLKSLPVMSSPRPGVYLAHGGFDPQPSTSIVMYVYRPMLSPMQMAADFQQAAQQYPNEALQIDDVTAAPPRVFAFGQTHIQGLWRWDANNSLWQPEKPKAKYSLNHDLYQTVAFNPGSVGFPRDGNGCPAYAVIDWERSELHFRRIPYDSSDMLAAMNESPYAELLAEKGFLADQKCQEG